MLVWKVDGGVISAEHVGQQWMIMRVLSVPVDKKEMQGGAFETLMQRGECGEMAVVRKG